MHGRRAYRYIRYRMGNASLRIAFNASYLLYPGPMLNRCSALKGQTVRDGGVRNGRKISKLDDQCIAVPARIVCRYGLEPLSTATGQRFYPPETRMPRCQQICTRAGAP